MSAAWHSISTIDLSSCSSQASVMASWPSSYASTIFSESFTSKRQSSLANNGKAVVVSQKEDDRGFEEYVFAAPTSDLNDLRDLWF